MKAGEHATAAPISVWRGKPRPLGASWDGAGVNFALYSENAEGVELCLFDPKGRRQIARIDVRERTNFVWHCYLPEARPGQLYGYRVHGPYAPEGGDRFNAHKLLLDPYARLVAGPLRWTDAHYGYRVGSRREDLSFDTRDSASAMPKCRVIDSSFTWGNDIRPQTPWEHTVIYELHVKGFTQLHPAIRPQLRGTYAGLSTAPVIAHLQRLGVTAVELMPVHSSSTTGAVSAWLRNYWGYNSIGFFARTPAMRRAMRSTSSRRWSRRCTRPGSKSCSTSFTTIRPKAIISARRCRFAASTIASTIVSTPRIRAITSITPAPETRSIPCIRRRSSW